MDLEEWAGTLEGVGVVIETLTCWSPRASRVEPGECVVDGSQESELFPKPAMLPHIISAAFWVYQAWITMPHRRTRSPLVLGNCLYAFLSLFS